jgi:hypothetical protein
MFCEQIKRLRIETPIDVAIAVSDMEGAKLCIEYDFPFVPTQNKPIGNKWNAALQLSVQQKNEYILDLIEYYVLTKEPYFGLKSLCFADALNKKAVRFDYFRSRLVGAGRMIRTDIVDKYGYFVDMQYHKAVSNRDLHCEAGQSYSVPYDMALYHNGVGYGVIASEPRMEMFSPELNSGLDNSFEMYMVLRGIIPKQINSEMPVLTDIKSGENLWSFEHIKGSKDVVGEVDYEWSIRMLGSVEKQLLQSIIK